MTRNDCKKKGKKFDPHTLSLTIHRNAHAHYLAWQIKAPSKPPTPPTRSSYFRAQFDAAIREDKASVAVVILDPSNEIIWVSSQIIPCCSPIQADASAALLAVESLVLLEISEALVEGDRATAIEDLSSPQFASDWTIAPPVDKSSVPPGPLSFWAV